VNSDEIRYGEFPHTTYVLLDASGSMTASRYWELARDFAVKIVKSSSPGEVKIAAFDQNLSKFFDRQDLAMHGLPPFGEILAAESKEHRTSIYDAVLHTVQIMPRIAPEDTIVVITDGGDNASRTSSSEVLNRLRDSHTRLLMVFVPDNPTVGIPQEIYSAQELLDVAKQSGGTIFNALPAGSESRLFIKTGPAPDAAERLAYVEKLEVWYASLQLGFRLKLPPIAKPAKVKVELVPKNQNVLLIYPKEIVPCRQSNR